MKKRELIYISIPIATNILSLLVAFKDKMYITNTSSDKILETLLLSVLVLVSNILIIILTGKIVRENKLSLENKFIKEKMKLQYDYYDRIKENQFRTRQLYHDMKNHILCIEGLSNNQDSKKYLDSLKDEIYILENQYNSGSLILDIILDEKESICKGKNINFDSKVDTSQLSFIEDIDICSIFSNVIDNAIEACSKMDENKNKNISIISTYVRNFYVIKVENTKENEIFIECGKYKTNKKDTYLHGIGLESVKRTVNKYNGEVVINHSDDKFVVKIMIPMKDKLPVM